MDVVDGVDVLDDVVAAAPAWLERDPWPRMRPGATMTLSAIAPARVTSAARRAATFSEGMLEGQGTATFRPEPG